MNMFSFDRFFVGLFVSIGCILIGLLIERRGPARPQGFGAIVFNIVYSVPASFLQTLLLPTAAALTTFATTNATSGSLITLPANGWRLLPALFVYIFAMDFGEYVFHRAQHRFPLLWSMHSLHHSDPAFNVSTTIRHYWLEHFIKSVTVYLMVGIIFKVNPIVIALYSLIGFYNYFTHMNLNVGFGRWSVVINSPQYHRIHHSALAEHHDRNFAALFPVFDLVFGSYRQPRPAEFPATGLGSHEIPSGALEAILWPFRHWLHHLSHPQAR